MFQLEFSKNGTITEPSKRLRLHKSVCDPQFQISLFSITASIIPAPSKFIESSSMYCDVLHIHYILTDFYLLRAQHLRQYYCWL